jgi:membrane associated rhomboid family serine protease
VYRLLTFSFIHPDPIWFGVNMIGLIFCGKKIERQLGTIVFGATAAIFSLIQGVILCLFFVLQTARDVNLEIVYEICISGFSGVLLSLAVAHAYKFTTSESISVLGVSVPYPVYPWLLAVALYFLPHAYVSPLAVGGVLGYAYVHGLLAFLFPGKEFGERLETTKLRSLTGENGFVPTTGTAPILPIASSQPTSPPAVDIPWESSV